MSHDEHETVTIVDNIKVVRYIPFISSTSKRLCSFKL